MSNKDDIIEINFTSQEKNSTIAELKLSIGKEKKISPDCLRLFFFANFSTKELHDTESLMSIIIDDSSNIKKDNIILYYQLESNQINVAVDFYQMKIDKIYIKLAEHCSVLMLKYILNQKLGYCLPINSQKLFVLGVVDKINKKKERDLNNKELSNNILIRDALNMLINKDNQISLDKFVLQLLLIRNENRKISMGLNFKFNYFKNMSKIKFNQKAPYYCECSDGLNLFCYCKNKSCEISNRLFVEKLGYGYFEIIKETYNIKCPKCNSLSFIEVRNIGLINSKWYYKGILQRQKSNSFEGDGITIDDQLYTLQEMKIINVIYKLYLEVKPYFINEVREDKIVIRQEDEDEMSSLDGINLYSPKMGIANKSSLSNENAEGIFNITKINSMSMNPLSNFENIASNGAKLVNYDVMESMDVLIDNNDKIECEECYMMKPLQSYNCIIL